jgi:hypothetical protein
LSNRIIFRITPPTRKNQTTMLRTMMMLMLMM